MSHLVSDKWFRKTQVIPEFGGFYNVREILLGGVSDCEELVDFTWRVSDCEELSGGYSQEMKRLSHCYLLFNIFFNF